MSNNNSLNKPYKDNLPLTELSSVDVCDKPVSDSFSIQVRKMLKQGKPLFP